MCNKRKPARSITGVLEGRSVARRRPEGCAGEDHKQLMKKLDSVMGLCTPERGRMNGQWKATG
jgi:hypothetical protein